MRSADFSRAWEVCNCGTERNESHAQKTVCPKFHFILLVCASVCVFTQFSKGTCNVVLVYLCSVVHCELQSGSGVRWGLCSSQLSSSRQLLSQCHVNCLSASNRKLHSRVASFVTTLMKWTVPLWCLRASFYNVRRHHYTVKVTCNLRGSSRS